MELQKPIFRTVTGWWRGWDNQHRVCGWKDPF